MIKRFNHTIPFSKRSFMKLANIAKSNTGIALDISKKSLIYNRLSKRIDELHLPDFDTYCDLLEQGSRDELNIFINAITTNVTYFFREQIHFDYLREVILPELLISNRNTRQIRIWSAGCSSGEEPYSIAMCIKDKIPAGWDLKILATDIDFDRLAIAKSGIYPESVIKDLSLEDKKKYFLKGTGKFQSMVAVNPIIKKYVSFKHLNLISHWPMRNLFDVIFCRNVAIYLTSEAQLLLFKRFRSYLPLRGYLIIGLAETLYQSSDSFKLIRNTIYKRIK